MGFMGFCVVMGFFCLDARFGVIIFFGSGNLDGIKSMIFFHGELCFERIHQSFSCFCPASVKHARFHYVVLPTFCLTPFFQFFFLPQTDQARVCLFGFSFQFYSNDEKWARLFILFVWAFGQRFPCRDF